MSRSSGSWRRRCSRDLPVVPEGMSSEAEEVTLNEDQRNAMDHLSRQIDTGRFGVTLLHGVTDSGKTELYIRAIEQVVRKGKAAIVLLPEIALTAQTVQRFSARFERVAVLHSGLTSGSAKPAVAEDQGGGDRTWSSGRDRRSLRRSERWGWSSWMRSTSRAISRIRRRDIMGGMWRSNGPSLPGRIACWEVRRRRWRRCTTAKRGRAFRWCGCRSG